MVGGERYCPRQRPHYWAANTYHQIVDATAFWLGGIFRTFTILTIDDRMNMCMPLNPQPVWQGGISLYNVPLNCLHRHCVKEGVVTESRIISTDEN